METERFVVEGRVQGVGFRNYVFSRSRSVAVDGYVRNLPDGSVECVARGSQEELEKLHRILLEGPPLGRVDRVSRNPSGEEISPGFEITF